ncbi:MAG TPA: VCBS repeat-containing protein [Spirochaetia bacterium]|nr:VCBS repeat-containing protein [Spirochaetia bacterium]
MVIQWRKAWIADEGFESAGVFDVDGDGVPDIVSGAFWYKGPDFRRKYSVGPVRKEDEYYDDFSTIPMDVNGDGRLDFITGGWWGNTIRWRENPGDAKKQWPEHVIAETGNVETTRAWDVDGDGAPELIPNTPGATEVAVFKLKTDGRGKGTGAFEKHVVHRFTGSMRQGHGLGCGDVAGNGRMDIVLAHGWLEAPANPWSGEWRYHADWSCGSASVPMLVVDVNGDGRNEIVVGQGHAYGLDWLERKGTKGDGGFEWTRHPIDPFNAQFHDLQWADLDGCGKPELVTGKRHRAHCGHEAGEWDDLGTYYFKWNGEGFTKQVISYGPIGTGKGCGIHFALADLRGTGRLDVVAPGKDGLYVFFNEGAGPDPVKG